MPAVVSSGIGTNLQRHADSVELTEEGGNNLVSDPVAPANWDPSSHVE